MNEKLKAAVRDVPDFPIKGILFKDITPILKDPALFRLAVDTLADRHQHKKLKAVVGIDARGFIFAGAVAYKLGIGFIPVRKKRQATLENCWRQLHARIWQRDH